VAVTRVHLAYGREGLEVDVPTDAVVVTPEAVPALADEWAAVTSALRAPAEGPPLHELVRRARRVAVVFPDLTRPMPNRTVLPPLLHELERCGAGPEKVALLCATGTHRSATAAEMAELIGPDLVTRYRVHDHRADTDAHVEVGRVDGVPIGLDRRYVDADLRIVTGFVEPHFFAGFSGGPKAVCPGLADLDTITAAHSPARIADRRATWLVRDGNPVHDFIRAATALAPPALAVDVTIDPARRLTSVVAAPLPFGHDLACAFVERTAVQTVDGRFDVVLSTNGGHPLDRNLYQAVKGMAAAERVVRPGGVIVMAAPCGDGLPDGGAFARLLGRDRLGGGVERGGRPRFDDEPDLAPVDPTARAVPDGWQVQVLDRVLARAEVRLHSSGLDDTQILAAGLLPAPDLDRALHGALEEAGPGATMCVLPEGPLTVATASAPA
jgi:lactate racemase